MNITVALVAAVGLGIGARLPTIAQRLVTNSAAAGNRCEAPTDMPSSAGRADEILRQPRHHTHRIIAAIVTAGILTLLVVYRRHDAQLPVAMITAIVGITAAYVDLRCLRLPDVLVLPGAVFCLISVAATAAAEHDPHRLAHTIGGTIAVTIGLLTLALVVGGLGMGDVKTGMWMSILAAWHSPTALLIAAAGPFVLQGAATTILLLTRRVTRHQPLPFGPALVAAGLAALVITG